MSRREKPTIVISLKRKNSEPELNKVYDELGNKYFEGNIFDYNKYNMQIYASNVNLARSVPDIRDGLKPVERRIVYTMKEILSKPGPIVKSARITGDCMGKYHPHGDVSIYSTMVGLARPWDCYPVLVEGRGNFGKITGDPAAAQRYTESSMSHFTYDNYFSEWNPNITDFVPNYDGKGLEPVYLPSKYPTILIKGSFGIGVGMRAGIPPFNINELVDMCIKLIKNPNYNKVWLYPDFHTGSEIIETDIVNICETGVGNITSRCIIDVLDNGNLWIRSNPYMTDVSAIEKKIINFARGYYMDGKKQKPHYKIHGIKNMENNTGELNVNSLHGVDIIIEVKEGHDPYHIRNQMYKYGGNALKSSFYVNLEAVYDYNNQHYSLKEMILDWIEIRKDLKVRIYSYEYSRFQKRSHLLEVIINILASDKDIISIVKKCKNKEDVINKLIENFNITDMQAKAIAEFKMYELAKENIERFKQEKIKVDENIKTIYNKLYDTSIINEEIISELKELSKKYGRSRVCKIVSDDDSEDYIPDTEHIIMITRGGYIKKLAQFERNVGRVAKDDIPITITKLHNTDSILVFDLDGIVYKIDIKDIPISDTNSNGTQVLKNIVSYVECSDNYNEHGHFIFVTRNGFIKRTKFKSFMSLKKRGVVAISLRNGDSLVDVISIEDSDKEMVMYTHNGKAIRFFSSTVPEVQKNSSGVIGIKLDSEDYVSGISKIENEKYLFIVSSKGRIKKTYLDKFITGDRNSEGLPLIPLTSSEYVVGIKPVNDGDIIRIVKTSENVDISVDSVEETPRSTNNKPYIKIQKNEFISDIRKIY